MSINVTQQRLPTMPSKASCTIEYFSQWLSENLNATNELKTKHALQCTN